MWLGSSVDRALHRYRKVMGSNPIQARIFFRLLFQLLKLIAHCENQISLTEIILFFLYYLKTSRISVVVVKRRHHEKWPIGENAIEVKRE